MSKVKFELNRAGVRELLSSAEVANLVQQYTQKVASNAGTGYEASVQQGKYRQIGRVSAVTWRAHKDNEENNTLLKALRSG